MGRNAYCMRFRPVPSEGESFMASKQKILIVDDDNNIAELISLYLTKECYDTKIVNDGEEAVREFHSFQPNLILLDLMLPGMDGYQVCREIRHDSDVPIIMLSAKGEVFDKVLGLELGADDYIIKPFDSKELVARVKAVLRRFQPSRTIPVSATAGKCVEYPDLIINQTNYSVIYQGRTVDMPPKELELLYFLASSPNQVFTREQLLDHIWGYEYIGDTRTVDVHIKRLREKIKDHASWAITTVWGIGYKFEVKNNATHALPEINSHLCHSRHCRLYADLNGRLPHGGGQSGLQREHQSVPGGHADRFQTGRPLLPQ